MKAAAREWPSSKQPCDERLRCQPRCRSRRQKDSSQTVCGMYSMISIASKQEAVSARWPGALWACSLAPEALKDLQVRCSLDSMVITNFVLRELVSRLSG